MRRAARHRTVVVWQEPGSGAVPVRVTEELEGARFSVWAFVVEGDHGLRSGMGYAAHLRSMSTEDRAVFAGRLLEDG